MAASNASANNKITDKDGDSIDMNHGTMPEVRVHGDPDLEELAELGLDLCDIVDFSTNLNPCGPAPAVLAAIRNADPVPYPDPQGRRVKRAIAAMAEVEPARIAFGAGAAALLWDLARLLTRKHPDRPAVLELPCFAELPAALRSEGSAIVEVAEPEPAKLVDTHTLSQAIDQHRPAFVGVSRPTSPGGQLRDFEGLAALADVHSEIPFVLDEAFLTLSEGHADRNRALPPNVIRIRSLTKDHAIAGARLAYLIAQPPLVRELEAARPPWTLSSAALAAVHAIADSELHLEESRQQLRAWRTSLAMSLEPHGLVPLPTTTAYRLFDARPRMGQNPRAATRLRRMLLQVGVLVRDATSFGLPGHVRLCARPPEDQARLLAALRKLPS